MEMPIWASINNSIMNISKVNLGEKLRRKHQKQYTHLFYDQIRNKQFQEFLKQMESIKNNQSTKSEKKRATAANSQHKRL